MRHTLTAAVFTLCVPAGALAQTPATPSPAQVKQVLSFNPFGLIIKLSNVEFERKVAPAVTLGGSASYLADSESAAANHTASRPSCRPSGW
jgi:hypothetical protein